MGQILKNTMKRISAEHCEKCGVRPVIEVGKKWCVFCNDVHFRGKRRRPEEAERIIAELVEPLYVNATLSDISRLLMEKLSDRKPTQDLYLYGLPGRGKTYIMAALIRHYTGQGYNCYRICFDDFCCQVRSTMSPASKLTEWDLTEPLKKFDMLFIDDLGLRSKQETDFVYITLYSIINKRQERLLPTFISSNKDLGRLRDSFDERIVSRLRTALVVEVDGKDRRIRP